MRIIKCPLCNTDMEIMIVKEVEIDKCPKCESVFLDKGELEQLAELDKNATIKAFELGEPKAVSLLEVLAGKRNITDMTVF